MAKIVGKDLELWLNGVEVPVISVSLSEAFDTLDSTDTATPATGKDFEVNRATRSFTAEAILYEPLGAELAAAATLVVGSRYQVTAVGTNLAAYEVGQIFTALTAITLAGLDTVKPLGAKVTGKTMELNIGGAICISSIDYAVKFDQLDVTDNCTTGDGSETIISRAERDTKVTAIMQDDEVDLLTTDPAAAAATLTFNTGQTVVGSILPISKSVADEAVGYAKVDYAFKWIGEPTETAVGLAVGGTEIPFALILKRGASTNKEYTGNCIVTEKTVSTDIKGVAKISYTIFINGAVTYAVAN